MENNISLRGNDLQQNAIDATIAVSSANDGNAAGVGTPEDTANAYQATISQQGDTANAYQATISQQGDTIDALLQANERLQQQIQRMLRMGAPITDGDTAASSQSTGNASLDSGINPPAQMTHAQIMEAPDYEPLAALGKEIGKKPKRE